MSENFSSVSTDPTLTDRFSFVFYHLCHPMGFEWRRRGIPQPVQSAIVFRIIRLWKRLRAVPEGRGGRGGARSGVRRRSHRDLDRQECRRRGVVPRARGYHGWARRIGGDAAARQGAPEPRLGRGRRAHRGRGGDRRRRAAAHALRD